MNRDPLPKGWTFVAVVLAVVAVSVLPDSGFGAGVVALVVVIAVALAARALYFRTNDRP